MADDRRVGVAVDFSACSKAALRWAVENVVRDGDHLILVNVQKEGHYEEGEMQLWEATGTRTNILLPLFLFAQYRRIPHFSHDSSGCSCSSRRTRCQPPDSDLLVSIYDFVEKFDFF